MITLKVNIENEIYANMFAELIANFKFVESVEITELTKTYHSFPDLADGSLILPAKKSTNPSKYYGIWANKNITDLKQFRDNLWQRTK
jgi:hypothetical protein